MAPFMIANVPAVGDDIIEPFKKRWPVPPPAPVNSCIPVWAGPSEPDGPPRESDSVCIAPDTMSAPPVADQTIEPP